MAEKILVVDDDFETLRLVGIMLERQGFEIIASNNGEQALVQAKNEHPDLIILDIMMPNLDGYQVCKQLRSDPVTANIPVLMFTAKTQLDDKMAGYDAGADDYLTKPVHPAELIAHIKALLTRRTNRSAASVQPGEKGILIGVVGSKGGLGVSALTLNLAISLSARSNLKIIAAEMHPGNGAWAIDLGFKNPDGLKTLLTTKPEKLNVDLIDKQLIKTTYGPRLLLASNNLADSDGIAAESNYETIIRILPQLADLVLLDLGVPTLPHMINILNTCDQLILVTEPFPACLEHARIKVNELAEMGFGKSKILDLIVINRVRADMQLSLSQIQDELGIKVTQMIPPAPEVAYFAAQKNIPLIELQPEGLLTQQFELLANVFLERIIK